MNQPYKPLKIEIGSGMNPQPGYLHLDCRTGLPGLSVVADILPSLPFQDGTVDEILSHSSIEHVSWRRVRETLTDWFRVLKPGGRAIIYTPDFRYLAEMYLKGQTDIHLDKSYIEQAKVLFGAYTPGAWAMIKMFAGQEYPENFHYACYDFPLLKTILLSAGFEVVLRIPPEYSLRVVATKSMTAPGTQKRQAIAEVIVQPGPLEPLASSPSAAHKRVSSGKKYVHVNLVDRGWILERMGVELERRLEYVKVGDGADPNAIINYHINYHAFKSKSNIDMALFTHIEENVPAAKALFFTVAKTIDYCVCMSKKYELILRAAGIQTVGTIMPGIELDRFRPLLRIGVVGRTYHTGRKGEELVARAMTIKNTAWYFVGEGWPRGGMTLPYEKLPEFYQTIDCLLVPALYEGGPMPVLEALASGKPVLSPPVGFVTEFPHIEYKAGDFNELSARINELIEKKLALRRSVEERTWEAWALEHHKFWQSVLPPTLSLGVVAQMPVVSQQTIDLPQSIAAIPCCSSSPGNKISGQPLKVLLVARKELLTGGPAVRIPILQDLLKKQGHVVDISYDPAPDPTGYDIAHVFNAWVPVQALAQMRHLKKFPVPVVLSPIFLDLAEMVWASRAQKLIFTPTVDAALRENYLEALANGSLMLDNRSRAQGIEIFPGANTMLREIISLADHIIGLSIEEMQRISKCLGVLNRPFSIVRNGAEYAMFGDAAPELFMSTYSIRDFVLCVGRIEARKNQAMLLYSLRESKVPIVLIGQTGEPDYEQLCRALAPPGTLFINQLNRKELASAYAAAKVCALPSWAEGASLSNLEAAAACCPLVVSNRASEFEYFGDSVRYCDPANWHSIASAVQESIVSFDEEKKKREELRNRLMATCTWEAAAEATVGAYRRAIGERKNR